VHIGTLSCIAIAVLRIAIAIVVAVEIAVQLIAVRDRSDRVRKAPAIAEPTFSGTLRLLAISTPVFELAGRVYSTSR